MPSSERLALSQAANHLASAYSRLTAASVEAPSQDGDAAVDNWLKHMVPADKPGADDDSAS